MDKIDLHTHSTFSSDGRATLADMVAAARANGLKYYGISDHFNYDYAALHVTPHGNFDPYIHEEAYFAAARAFQTECEKTGFNFLVSCELGFADNKECCEKYQKTIERYRPDYVINSVHAYDGEDFYYEEFFKNKPLRYAYGVYLDCIRASLDAPYPYDIVGHIGYASRNAPYENRKLRYTDFASAFDDILKTIIAKNKILEVNTSARGAGSAFLPDTDVLERYFELGGRNISFASDAHNTARLCEKYEETAAALKKIGFTYFTVPVRGKRERVAF